MEAALDALVHSGQSGLLEIAGQPGIGKSRLMAELRVRADYLRLIQPRGTRGRVGAS